MTIGGINVQHRRRRTASVVLVAVAMSWALVAGCTSDAEFDAAAGASPTEPAVAVDPGPAELTAGAGTGQIWVRTDPDVELELVGSDGEVVLDKQVDLDTGDLVEEPTRTTDDNGAAVFRYVDPGAGYVVRRVDDPEVNTEALTVTDVDEHPDQSFYDGQELTEGYGYLTTRDGTELAVNVTLPGPVEDGPYPTVIEYSGYDPASPTASTVTISKTLAAQFGFATVGVNLRGSGCSGGSFQLWEDAVRTDGYDVVETVAAQDWSKGDVGMVGISYPASAMLYAASTQPPHLAAIAPMAAYDDGFRALLWPGGIQNKGFARQWIQERYEEAQDPNPSDWVKKRIAEGDATCADNMQLRGQNVDLASLIDVQPFFPEVEDLGDSFAPRTFVDRIEVPTYLVAAWQDEQVGGHAPSMIPEFDGVDDAWFTLVNGIHAEGLADPSILQGWLEFLQLFVAEQVPDTSKLAGLQKLVSGEIIKDQDAVASMPIPEGNYSSADTYDEALARFRERPRVRVLMDEGGSAATEPGVPVAAFEHAFDTFPPAQVEPTTWYLGPDGTLTEDAPDGGGDAADAYTSDPSVRPEDYLLEGEDAWERLPGVEWESPEEGTALSYVSEPLDDGVTMVGTASADLWVRSSAPDTDLQVTVTEVRPDGKETYVQSGWLRASKRALDEDVSTVLQPIPTQKEGDAEPLPDGEFVPVRVEIHPFAHAFRPGSRIRVVVSAPGADRPVWNFVTLKGTQDNEIARSEDRPSAVVFPVVPGLDIPTPLPACPSLRGQPCRTYEPMENGTAEDS